MKVEINPAQRPWRIVLAQDDRNVFVQRDAVPKLCSAAFVSLNRLVHQRNKRGFKFFGYFVDADHVAVVRAHRFH